MNEIAETQLPKNTLAYTSQLTGIEVVLKLSSNCNLDCSYCYYYHRGNDEAAEYAGVISRENLEAVAGFFKQGILDLGLEWLRIDFHGGEPMLMKKSRFDWMCSHFTKVLSPHLKMLQFVMQTNAVLVDEEWINLFAKHQVCIGVSLDGPKKYNDMYRLDKKGKSSYQDTVNGVELLRNAYESGRIPSLGVLCVINPEFDARSIYNHFVHDLGFKGFDFLLPDSTHDNYVAGNEKAYGNFLVDLFHVWSEGDYRENQIRIMNNAIARFSGDTRSSFTSFSSEEKREISFSIQTDGLLGPDDTFFSTPIWKQCSHPHVSTITLRDYLNGELFVKIDKESRAIPEECQSCCWKNICGGGSEAPNRYSSVTNSTLHPSVHCGALKEFYSAVAAFLLNNGMNPDRLLNLLFDNDELKIIRRKENSQEALAC